MSFDPSQPFDLVNEPAQQDQPEQQSPAFDPSQPFEIAPSKHEDIAGRLETMHNASSDAPDQVAKHSNLAKAAGVTYEVAKAIPDEVEKQVNKHDWIGLATKAPKTAQHLTDDHVSFQILKNDVQKLAEVEQSRSTSNNDPQKHGLTDLVKGGLSPLSFSALQKDVIDAYSYFKIEEHQAWLRHLDAVEKSKSWDEARQEVDRIRSMPKSQQYSEFHNLTGQQVTDSHLDKNKNLRNSYDVLDAVAGGIGRKKSREERAKYPDADKTYNAERSVLGEMSQEKASDVDAMKVKGLSPYSPEWFVQEGLGSVAQTGKSIATASVPGLGLAMFYGSVGGAYLNDKEHASLSDADKLEGARVHAGAEYIGESLGTGKLLEVIKDSGMHALKKWMYAAMANGTEEHATEIVTQTYDAAKRGEIPSLNPEEANDASYFDKTLAFIDGQLQAYVLGAIGGGAAGVGGSAVQSTGKAIVGRIDARIKAKKQAVIDKHNSLLGEVQKVEEMEATHLDSVTVRNALESMDDNERSLYVDPSQLLNQEGLSRQQVEALMPSVSLSEINQALQVGGTIKVPRNELITNLAATKDLDNESITRHFKEDPTSDSKYEMEMAGIDDKIKQADILIAKSADSEKLKTQRGEVYQQALKDLNESGMFKGGNDKRASIWAAMATATAMRTGMAPMDLYKQAFGRVTDEAAIGDGFNQYAGQKAQGADLTALQRAKQAVNSGADAEQTRQETGWFRGPDNKWRFEIDDSKAVFKGGPTAEDAILRAVKAGESGNPVMLADVLRHESLFAAYPELKNIEIRFTEKGEKSRGAYSPESNVIAIRGDLSAAEAKSTLLHEIQHAIQGHEGFARGGNENEFTDRQEFGANVEKLSNQISAIMEENPDAAQAYRARNQVQMEARNPDGKYVWTDALIAKLEAAEKVLTSTEAGKQLYELDLERSYDKNTVTYSSAFDQYRKLHGEIEARDTQARADMSAEDRMASKPYISQGIPDDQVIVRLGGNGVQRSEADKPKRFTARLVQALRGDSRFYQSAQDQTKTPAFKRWFGDSKVVDAQGKPLVMYHGTNQSQGGEAFTSFETYASNYGLMGMGGYFTADPSVASSYTKKGRGDTPSVYPVYLSIKNPIDMDAKADVDAWVGQFEDIEQYHEGGDTNESWYRAAEAMIADQDVPSYEGAETMQGGLRSMGFDGITHMGGGRVKSDGIKHRVYVAFDPEQIKSAIGNNGAFDPANPNILMQNKAAPRGTYDPSTRNINLTRNADLSTFLHESGHMFLDIMVDMSLTENASESLKKDMDVTMRWFGIDGDTPGMRLYNWSGMSINEKRQFHEKWAESFEQYLFEGKAPSIELAHVFSSFRQWLLHVYKSISQFVSSHDGAKLNDEVRGVFDRMLATEEQIQEAEAARGMLPLFDKKPDNMTDAEWEVMQQAADDYARSAFDQMTARSLRDMKWLSNAKNKTLRKLQREADAQRREAHMEARQQILSQNIYRAWQFLKAPVEGAVAANKKAKASKDIDSSRDSLLTAIAKLGGLNMEQAVSQYGLDSKDFHHKGGMFSMPVLRKTGGMSPDAMGEALSQYGYLPLDEHGKWDIQDLEDKLREEAAGNPQYSDAADYDVLLGDSRYAEAPTPEEVDFVGGRLSRQAIREMYDDADLAGMQGEQAADSLALEGYTQSKKVDGGDNERQYVLFGDEAQGSGDGSKRKAAKKSSGNVDSTKTIPGRYATIVGNEVARKIDAGFDKLDTPEKIAYATSHITRNPQEVLLVVATDKNHKPISILRHAIGMKDSASVDQGVVAGWATNVQGAAHVWISHNHPSGKSDISEADRRISGAIGNLLDGTGIEYHGIMAVTHEGVFSYDNNSVTSGSNINNEKIPAPEKSVSVNVVEREFKSTGKLHADKSGISDLASAIKISEEVSGGESGVVLLDAQYRPVGFMPIDFAGAKYIRGEKLQSDLLSAIELTNALAVVSYTKDTSGDAEIGIKNVGGLLSLSRVTPLDVLVDSGQAVRSWAYQGEQLNWGTFRQQNGKDSNDKRTLESMGVLSDEGLHPDTVADLFGLSSGDELVRKLLTMPDPVAEIERLTDEIMLQRHADLATPEARERAAEAAIHNEAHVKFLATELTALNRAIGKPRMVMAAAKEYAAQIVSGSLIKDLNTGKYEAAEVKAGRAAEQAFISGNKNEAALQKRNQVLHAMTVKMVNDAKDEMEKHLSYLKKFDKFNKKIDPDYQEQIDTLLERYDLREKSLKAIQRSQNLGQWIEQQKAMGLEPVIPDKLLDESQRTNYKLLTVEEMRGLVDAVKNIEHLGRLKNRLLTDKAKRELNALADAVGKSISDNGGAVKPVKIERNSTMDRLSDLASGFFSMHRKLASIVRQLDGWKDGGLLWETMIRPMNEAGDNEAVMHEKSTLALAEVFAPLKGKNLTKKMYIPMIANSLSYEGRLAVALNWGNEGNRQRLMDGDNWGVPEVGAILATLTADDWKFVQGVWDHIATYKDAIGEQQKRLTGIEPSWVDATPFEIKSFDGQMVQVRGGYYPAKYDTTRSTQALSNEAAGNVFDQWKAAKGQGKTRDGFTKSRATQVVDRPIRKDFGVITQHITEVTHRLAWQDWVVDMNRLLKKEQVDSSIRAHYGNEILEEMRKAIEDITTGDMTAQSSFEKAINHLRIGTTIVGLGYNLTTSLLQPFGLTQSMVRIGPKWVAKGLSTWIGNPARMNERTEWVYSKSDFMRLRGKTMMREMNEILNSVRKEKLSKLEASYFYGIQKMQVIADMPTWLGQYEKSMAEFDGDESKAIALADQAVLDAQGGGQNKDLSRIQRGGPLLKLWTNFYSFFNTTYNLTREVAGRTDVKDPASVAKAAVDMLLLYSIPSVMGSILKGVMAGDDDDDELADRILRDQMSYLFGTMVGLREISAAFSGFNGYQGPAGTRFFSEVAKFGKQAEQGEADAAFLKSLNNIGGIIFHYPAGQINRTVEGANALMDGETDNMSALIFGKPK